MPDDDGSYNPDEADRIRELMEEFLEEQIDNPALNEGDIIYSILDAVSRVKEDTSEQSLSDLADQAFLDTAEGEALTRKAEEYGVQRQEARRATGVLEFSRENEATTDYTIPEGTRARTTDGEVEFETTTSATLEEGDTSVKVNARAVEGGTDGNLPSDKLVVLPSPPSGVESVTNPEPTGDDEYENTDGDSLTVGRDEEEDEDLRDRVYDATSLGGAATPSAIRESLEDISEVRSYDIEINHTSEEKDGMDPYSMEVIVDGAADDVVAEALYDSLSITQLLRLQSGIRGEEESHTIESDVLDQTVTVEFSRPEEVGIEVDVELVVGEEYIGDDDIADKLVQYVGGEQSDGTNASGLAAGRDVYEDRIRNILTDEDTDVIGITDLTLDTDGDGDDDTEENDDGLSVIKIGDNETAIINADDVEIETTEV